MPAVVADDLTGGASVIISDTLEIHVFEDSEQYRCGTQAARIYMRTTVVRNAGHERELRINRLGDATAATGWRIPGDE
jgi:hypothetical protein